VIGGGLLAADGRKGMSAMTQAKIMRMDDARQTVMRLERGTTAHLVGPADGARNVDVHINHINTDSGLGPYHFHRYAENVYVVLSGVAQAVVDGKRYLLVPDDVAYLPPGVPHAAGSAGFGPAVVMEIYAPAGKDFTIIETPSDIEDVERPEIAHLLPSLTGSGPDGDPA
jgi:mannose-6-phosphate isomerase-like protein (cupin superfamily)